VEWRTGKVSSLDPEPLLREDSVLIVRSCRLFSLTRASSDLVVFASYHGGGQRLRACHFHASTRAAHTVQVARITHSPVSLTQLALISAMVRTSVEATLPSQTIGRQSVSRSACRRHRHADRLTHVARDQPVTCSYSLTVYSPRLCPTRPFGHHRVQTIAQFRQSASRIANFLVISSWRRTADTSALDL